MADGIVLLDADSLAAAAKLQQDLGGARAWLFDPTLADKAREAGLEAVELVPWIGPTPYPDLVRWAHAEAARIESLLDRPFAELHPGHSLRGWLHLTLHYLLLSLQWHTELWTAEAARFDDHTVHLLVNDNPAHYYWPSFVPGLLLMQRLRARGTEMRAYTYGARADASLLVPDLQGDSAPLRVLTHLPTCFHDSAWFNAELARVAGPIVNLQARHWNVEITAAQGQIGQARVETLHASLDADAQQRITAVTGQARAVLDAWLQPLMVSADYRQRQVDFLCALLHGQLVTFHALQRHFGRRTPDRIVLTEHDAGFHGPLLSFAASRGIPVLVLPHSKTIGDVEFPQAHTTTLVHPIQPEGVQDADGRVIPHAKLAYPERFSGGTRDVPALRHVGLLLNGLSLGGIACTAWDDYVAGITRLATWCRQRGLQLSVRSRPGQVMTEMLMQATGLPAASIQGAMQQPLAGFAESVDLCLMYDAPTNASIDFLQRNVALLNPVPSRLSRAEALTCDPAIVPREEVLDCIDRLERFVRDPDAFQAFRQQQFAAYVGAFARARPLHAFL